MSHRIDGKLRRALNSLEEGRLKQAEILYLECLDKLPDRQSHAYKQALHGLGFVKSQLKDFTEANEIYLELLQRARDEGNRQDEALVYHQLGMVKRSMGKYHQAISLFQEAQARYGDTEDQYPLELAVILYEQAIAYVEQEQGEQAYPLLEKSLRYAEKIKDDTLIGQICQELVHMTAKDGDSQQMRQFYEQAIKAFKQSGDDEAIKKLQNQFKDNM